MNLEAVSSLKDFLGEWLQYNPPSPQRVSIFDILKERNVSHKVYHYI